MTKFTAIYEQYEKAVSRLDEILREEKTDVTRDSAVKRFEMAFDLAWKLVKTYLFEAKGILCYAPKECFREAYRAGILDYDEFWLTVTDMRNEAVHTYSEKFAEHLYKRLPEALRHFRLLLEKVK